MNKKTLDFKSVKKPRKISVYKISKIAHRQNPIFKIRLEEPVICIFCKEKQQDSAGHKKKWRSLNSLHGHLSYDHFNMNFKNWLESLAGKIISGELK